MPVDLLHFSKVYNAFVTVNCNKKSLLHCSVIILLVTVVFLKKNSMANLNVEDVD